MKPNAHGSKRRHGHVYNFTAHARRGPGDARTFTSPLGPQLRVLAPLSPQPHPPRVPQAAELARVSGYSAWKDASEEGRGFWLEGDRARTFAFSDATFSGSSAAASVAHISVGKYAP